MDQFVFELRTFVCQSPFPKITSAYAGDLKKNGFRRTERKSLIAQWSEVLDFTAVLNGTFPNRKKSVKDNSCFFHADQSSLKDARAIV